jgi:hypothetical protein
MPVIMMELFTLQLSTKVKSMNGNLSKGNEKQLEIDLNQQLGKHVDEKFNTTDKSQEAPKGNNNKADKQLFALNNTLKNMIRTNRMATMPAQKSLTGFYKEISNSIKRN